LYRIRKAEILNCSLLCWDKKYL